MAHTDLNAFMEGIKARNPHEPTFVQAVHEFAEAVFPFARDRTAYRQARILERMTEPDRIVSFRVCWVDDAGEVRINRGYRVQFNGAIGPYKGGLRFHPTVNQDILKFLGFEQCFKNALTTLPMGGGKGGSDFDPKGKTDTEVMRFCHAFMAELHRHIGPNTDVPAGDIGVGAREIGYLFGKYRQLRNEFTGVLTGKGRSFGGSVIRPEATGYGNVYFTQEMLQAEGQELEGKTVTISGSGNVAQYTAEKALQLGAKVVTLSDSGGFIHDPDGLTLEKLSWVMALKNDRRGRIQEYADEFKSATFHEGERPWSVPCQVAFPSATQNEISGDDAKTLISNGVQVVSEGANMPSTLEAVSAFRDAKTLFGPAKAANAGGVAVSGLEQTQNAMRVYWDRDEVDRRLQEIMKDIHETCAEYGKQDGGRIDYVIGANVGGFVKVADAMLAYGVI